MSKFDWAAKGPSILVSDPEFNGVNTRKSVTAQKHRATLPFTDISNRLDHSVADDNPTQGDQDELE